MKKTIATMVISLGLMSSAMAEERVGDAALGALSGALVLGPIGAVAGAVVGYSAGPSIARSWGLGGSGTSRQRRSARAESTSNVNNSPATPRSQIDAPTATAVPQSIPKSASATPAVQPLE
jgi:hypothetical protein